MLDALRRIRWWRGLLLLTLAMSCASSLAARPAAALAIQPVSWWQQRYDSSWPQQYAHYLPLSQSADSWDYYNLAYALDGPVALYLATDDPTYLDQALVFVNNMVAAARPSRELGPQAFGDDFLGWVSHQNGQDGNEVPLYESYAWRYVTRLLLVIRTTPALYADPAYRADYERLLAFTEVNIFDKWYTRGVNAYIYRQNTHMAAHWAFIAMDLSRLTSDPTRRARAQQIVADINFHLPNYANASLHGQMQISPLNAAAYFWSADWGETARPGQDVAHGNNVIAYLVEAHDLHVGGWTDADMQRLCVLFDQVVWPAAGQYAEFVDGSGTGNGWFAEGFMKLGRYSAAIQQRLEQHTVAEGVSMFGNGALNARRLLDPPPFIYALPLVLAP